MAFSPRTSRRCPPGGAILALGRIAHDAALRALGRRPSSFAFAHGARHPLDDGSVLFDSYHCSRYNTNTRRLTPAMFRAVFDAIAAHLGARREPWHDQGFAPVEGDDAGPAGAARRRPRSTRASFCARCRIGPASTGCSMRPARRSTSARRAT